MDISEREIRRQKLHMASLERLVDVNKHAVTLGRAMLDRNYVLARDSIHSAIKAYTLAYIDIEKLTRIPPA